MGGSKRKAAARAMRKIDVDDVEEAINEERAIKRLRGNTQRGKQALDASGLFTVDVKGSSEGLSAKTKRELARAKLFPPKPPNIGISADEEARLSKVERTMLAKKNAKKIEDAPVFYDLWSAPGPYDQAAAEVQGIRDGTCLVKRAAHKLPEGAPKTLSKKNSTAATIIPAHEGQSMNPEPAAFEDLSCAAAAKQLEQEREEEATQRRLNPMTSALVTHFGKEAVEEMDDEAKIAKYRGLIVTVADVDDGNEDPGVETKITRRRKSQAQKNRELKRRNQACVHKQQKSQKDLIKQVGEIPTILQELEHEEKVSKEKKEYRKRVKVQEDHLEFTEGIVPKRRQLGKMKFREDAVEIPDAAAAAKGLRAMPLHRATAIKERIASWARRGVILPPRQAQVGDARAFRQAKKKLQKMRKPYSPLQVRQGLDSNLR